VVVSSPLFADDLTEGTDSKAGRGDPIYTHREMYYFVIFASSKIQKYSFQNTKSKCKGKKDRIARCLSTVIIVSLVGEKQEWLGVAPAIFSRLAAVQPTPGEVPAQAKLEKFGCSRGAYAPPNINIASPLVPAIMTTTCGHSHDDDVWAP